MGDIFLGLNLHPIPSPLLLICLLKKRIKNDNIAYQTILINLRQISYVWLNLHPTASPLLLLCLLTLSLPTSHPDPHLSVELTPTHPIYLGIPPVATPFPSPWDLHLSLIVYLEFVLLPIPPPPPPLSNPPSPSSMSLCLVFLSLPVLFGDALLF